MGRQVGTVAWIAAVFILSVPAVASACDEASESDLGVVSGRAGDTVSFQLAGTPEGAQYAVTVEGAAAGGGRDGDPAPGTQASLLIPDLGPAPRDAQAVVSVSCEGGGGWQSSLTVHYAGRPASPAGPTKPARPAAGGPAPAPQLAAPVSRSETGRRRPSRRSGGGVKGFRRSFSALGPALLEATGTPPRAKKAKKLKERKKRRRKARKREARDEESGFGRPAPPQVGGGGADLSGGDIGIPGPTVAWRLLAAVALAGLVTIALLARRSRRRRLLPR